MSDLTDRLRNTDIGGRCALGAVALSKLIDEAVDRLEELEQQNTFWACEKHRNNNTLRCAICDEAENKRLREAFDARQAARIRQQDAEIKRLRARNWIMVEALSEIKATNDGDSSQPVEDILDGCVKELEALEEMSYR